MAISLYELSQRISSSMPLGTIVPYYGTDEPSGWKICDGRSCAGSELAKKLGISNVPDLRGRFIRMIGGNAAGMAVAQGENVGAHQHDIFGGEGGNRKHGFVADYLQSRNSTGYRLTYAHPSGSGETRPINMAFNYIIKVNTNVILYYVSNIIYKAIAIGKSLLSRVKEEVRRTMAISLKNHEDRIWNLETKGKWIKLVDHDNIPIPTSAGEVHICSFNKDEIGLIFVLFTYAADMTKLGHMSVLPAGYQDYSCQLWPIGAPVNENEIIAVRVHYGDVYAHSTASAGQDNIIYSVWGLKLYYNFSYNIYRLTQRLFDSSLLGLFSQKGGARTI